MSGTGKGSKETVFTKEEKSLIRKARAIVAAAEKAEAAAQRDEEKIEAVVERVVRRLDNERHQSTFNCYCHACTQRRSPSYPVVGTYPTWYTSTGTVTVSDNTTTTNWPTNTFSVSQTGS